MQRKDRMDAFGTAAMIGFAVIFAMNQVAMKVTNQGFQPVFGVALRSVLALPVLVVWMRLRGIPLRPSPGIWPAGLLIGTVFSVEFICLFISLDLTTVTRCALIFYTMPIWLALAAHFLLPGERLTRTRMTGLLIAFAGVAWTILDRSGTAGKASLAGDLLALVAALGWGSILLCVRLTRLAQEPPERQLFWQVAVSTPVMLAAAPFFGPLVRDAGTLPIVALLFQSLVVLFFAFIAWLALVKRYPASSIASFSFLTPVGSVLLGWWLLGEEISPVIVASLVLVAVGLTLMNRAAGERRRVAVQPASAASAQTGR